MPLVDFTPALRRFVPELKAITCNGNNVAGLLKMVFEKYPSLKSYILEDQGALRKHVQIYINENRIKDNITFKDIVNPDDKILIMQALSGG